MDTLIPHSQEPVTVYQLSAPQLRAMISEIKADLRQELDKRAIEQPIDMEAAEAFLGLTPKSIAELIRSGHIRGHKLGRLWRFYRSELNEDIKARSTQDKIRQLKTSPT